MKNVVTALCLAVVVFASAVVSALAVPPGIEKKGEMPPGFSHGKKTGWKDNYPPGWDNRSEKEKGKWTEDVQKGRETISKVAEGKDLSKEEIDAAADDFEKAARKGVDPADAESLVKDAVAKGKKGKDLSDSVAEESEKHLKDKKDKGKGSDETKGSGKGNKEAKGKGKGKSK